MFRYQRKRGKRKERVNVQNYTRERIGGRETKQRGKVRERKREKRGTPGEQG